MQLSKVVLKSSNFDPKVRSDKLMHARCEFSVDDGYELTQDASWLYVRYGECTVGFPHADVKHVFLAAAKAVEQPVIAQARPDYSGKGKRR